MGPYLKSIVPFVATIIAVLIQVIATGEFDRAELVTALSGILTSLVVWLVPNVNASDQAK